ncbi:MAG: ArsA family ATPase [Halolamina sp.]
MNQFVLYGGKGGVGKTTLAAATGLKAARNGHRTLVVSTDPAHSIADAYEASVGETPVQVTDVSELYAMEVDPRERFAARYGDLFDDVLEDLRSFGVDVGSETVDEVTKRTPPGTDEFAVVDLFAEYHDDPEWDVVVFDTAPTGHTLRLLDAPDIVDTTAGKLLSLKGQVDSVTSTVRSVFGSGDGSGQSYSSKLDTLQRKLESVSRRLQDPDRTEFRAVTVAEQLSIAETDRLLDELAASGIPVGDVLANKVLLDPDEDCETCQARHREQQDALDAARERFDATVREVPLVSGARGVDRVDAVVDHVPGVDL